MAGPIPLEAGHSPAAHCTPCAAGRPFARASGAWIKDRVRDLATVLVVSTVAFGVFLAAMGILALVIAVAHAQEPTWAGQGSDARIGGITVTAPDCRQPQNPAPACAVQRLNQAAKGAEAKGQAAATTAAITVPDAQTSAATIGLTTPAAVSEQFGPNFGKSVTPYRPPPPPSEGGRFVRSRP